MKRIIIGFTLILSLGLVYFYLSNKTTRNQGAIGWVPTNIQPPPFHPGVIFDGQSPADFEIALVEPKDQSTIFAKPGESVELTVSINVLESSDVTRQIPPTFVTPMLTMRNKKHHSLPMTPYRKQNLTYFYVGKIEAPETVGDYQIHIEAEYAIFDKGNNKSLNAKTFRKSTKGLDLHVRK